jgi:hypothetical protein
MQKYQNRIVAIVVGLMISGCHFAQLDPQRASAADKDEKATRAAASVSATRFLVVGKGKIGDPQQQQQRGIVAVQKVAKAAMTAQHEAIVDAFAEDVMTVAQYRRGQAKEKVTGAIFRERLRQLTEVATPQDTVVIYTHSHGRRNGFEESQPLGGIVMDLPVRQPEHGGTFLWDEYADLILGIPARNVVVLTMSCFSGGLVEHLNSRPVSDRWRDRRRKEGRNLIVLTSQNKELLSNPIVRDGEVINPFTYAVAMAFEGEADGFHLEDGNPAKPRPKDGKLTVGEMIEYILYTTENTPSESAMPLRKNTAKPQLTGSFSRKDVLLVRGNVASKDYEDKDTAQPDAAADADKPRR